MSNAPEELTFEFVPRPPTTESASPVDDEKPDRPRATPTVVDDPAESLLERIDRLRSASKRSGTQKAAPSQAPAIEKSADEDPSVLDGSTNVVDGLDADGEVSDEALTIAAFYERVRRALAGEFEDEVWVVGEIRGYTERRGHRYFELADEGVERSGRGVAQQLEAVCWARDWPRIERDLAEAGVDLEVGRMVRVRGRVSVWEGGSRLRFTIVAIDVDALLGGIAAARHRLLQALTKEGLLEANRRLPLAVVPLRIGLVTSPGSEAHRDFLGQLDRSGYAFDVHFEASLVQGSEAPNQIAAALVRLAAFEPELAIVVRGGGARGDLAAFDSEAVARAIATAPFPVWTGIGHTGDRAVADEIAHRAFITPTACGEAVVEHVNLFWEAVLAKMSIIAGIARSGLDAAHQEMIGATHSVARCARFQLERRSDELGSRHRSVARAAHVRLAAARIALDGHRHALDASQQRLVSGKLQGLDHARQVLRAYEPRRQLERGWTLTKNARGHVIRSVGDLRSGEVLTTVFADGEVDATVDQLRNAPQVQEEVER